MPFFTANNFQPKRKFRFSVHFRDLGEDLVFMAKTAQKPSYNIESTSHRFLNHEFKFPNIVQWQDVSISFVDAVDPNIGSKFYDTLINMGYLLPSTIDQYKGAVTKQTSVGAIGGVVIRQLDGGGVVGLQEAGAGATQLDPSVVDEWELINAWITSCKFGEGLDYSSNDLVTVDLTLKYDFAEYRSNVGTIIA